jgi:hypothetical protein
MTKKEKFSFLYIFILIGGLVMMGLGFTERLPGKVLDLFITLGFIMFVTAIILLKDS